MICNNCGREAGDGDFCIHCGGKLVAPRKRVPVKKKNLDDTMVEKRREVDPFENREIDEIVNVDGNETVESTVFCRNCGQSILESAVVCIHCGERASEEKQETVENTERKIVGNKKPVRERIERESREIPKRETPKREIPKRIVNSNFDNNNINQEIGRDNPDTLVGVISCCFPLVGLILYCLWKQDKPKSSKSVCNWMILGFALWIGMYILSVAAFLMV